MLLLVWWVLLLGVPVPSISAKNENTARSGTFDPSILPLLLVWGSSGKEVRQYQTDSDHPDEITWSLTIKLLRGAKRNMAKTTLDNSVPTTPAQVPKRTATSKMIDMNKRGR